MDGMDGMGPFVQELLADDDHAHLHNVPLETTACNIPLSEAGGSTAMENLGNKAHRWSHITPYFTNQS